MSSKAKINKNREKKSVSQSKQSHQNNQTVSPSVQNRQEHRKQSSSPPANLMVVREASVSSEEGQSRKQSYRSKAKRQQRQEIPSKVEKSVIQEQYMKQDQTIYDQYNVLKISGLLDAYEHFLKLLCKHGLPTGKVYEYAAQEIQKYERRKINKQLKMKAELDIQKISKRNQQISPSLQKSRNLSPYYS